MNSIYPARYIVQRSDQRRWTPANCSSNTSNGHPKPALDGRQSSDGIHEGRSAACGRASTGGPGIPRNRGVQCVQRASKIIIGAVQKRRPIQGGIHAPLDWTAWIRWRTAGKSVRDKPETGDPSEHDDTLWIQRIPPAPRTWKVSNGKAEANAGHTNPFWRMVATIPSRWRSSDRGHRRSKCLNVSRFWESKIKSARKRLLKTYGYILEQSKAAIG